MRKLNRKCMFQGLISNSVPDPRWKSRVKSKVTPLLIYFSCKFCSKCFAMLQYFSTFNLTSISILAITFINLVISYKRILFQVFKYSKHQNIASCLVQLHHNKFVGSDFRTRTMSRSVTDICALLM